MSEMEEAEADSASASSSEAAEEGGEEEKPRASDGVVAPTLCVPRVPAPIPPPESRPLLLPGMPVRKEAETKSWRLHWQVTVTKMKIRRLSTRWEVFTCNDA